VDQAGSLELACRAIRRLVDARVMVHSSLGMRTVVQDYFKGRAQSVVLGLLYTLTAVLVALGSHVIITLPLK